MVHWNLNSRKRRFGLLSGILLLLSTVGVVTADQAFLRDSRILPNVFITNIDVGGLSREEAESKLQLALHLPTDTSVALTDQSEVWFVPARKIDFKIDIKETVTTCMKLGRGNDFMQRWHDRLASQGHELNLPIHVELNKEKLAETLAEFAPQTDRKARNAALQVMVTSKNVTLIPSVVGRTLNVAETVAAAFREPQMQRAFVIELKFNKQLPQITDNYFSGINTILALYSTHFNPWDQDRNANLRLASQRIHETRLNPGEIFSYNNTVGTRTQQQGFRMAPVILDGKLVPDWGGGVCQVSSTLYNSVLLANLEIVDRSNHGRAIGYVPLGFDATVVDGYIDFKFKNNLARPIMLYNIITDNKLYFSILGDAKDLPPPIELDYIVHRVIEPVEVKQPDPTLEVGKETVEESPQRGFRVSTYRIRTVNGNEERQLLATDDYDPVNRIIKIGTKPKDKDSTATATTAPPKTPPATNAGGVIQGGTITLQGQITKPKR